MPTLSIGTHRLEIYRLTLIVLVLCMVGMLSILPAKRAASARSEAKTQVQTPAGKQPSAKVLHARTAHLAQARAHATKLTMHRVERFASTSARRLVDSLPPPEITLTSTPAATTGSTSATFAWSAPNALWTHCDLDHGASTPCSGSATYSGLSVGTHTFAVAGSRGGRSKTVSFTWKVIALPASTPPSGTPGTTPTTPDAPGGPAVGRRHQRWLDRRLDRRLEWLRYLDRVGRDNCSTCQPGERIRHSPDRTELLLGSVRRHRGVDCRAADVSSRGIDREGHRPRRRHLRLVQPVLRHERQSHLRPAPGRSRSDRRTRDRRQLRLGWRQRPGRGLQRVQHVEDVQRRRGLRLGAGRTERQGPRHHLQRQRLDPGRPARPGSCRAGCATADLHELHR